MRLIDIQFPHGLFIADELPLADEYVRHIGNEVAAVAAIDEDTAEEALDLIKVEYEELSPVLDPEKAMEPGAPAIHPEIEGIKQKNESEQRDQNPHLRDGKNPAKDIGDDRCHLSCWLIQSSFHCYEPLMWLRIKSEDVPSHLF